MWILYETFDPRSKDVFLDLQSDKLPPPARPEPLFARAVESFADAITARSFAEIYLSSIGCSESKVTRSVHCGPDRPAACLGPGHPCALGLDSYACPVRCGP